MFIVVSYQHFWFNCLSWQPQRWLCIRGAKWSWTEFFCLLVWALCSELGQPLHVKLQVCTMGPRVLWQGEQSNLSGEDPYSACYATRALWHEREEQLSVEGICAACSWKSLLGGCLMLRKWGVPRVWRHGSFLQYLYHLCYPSYENCSFIKPFVVGPFLLRSRKDPHCLPLPSVPHHMRKSLLPHVYLLPLHCTTSSSWYYKRKKGIKIEDFFVSCIFPNLQTLRTD